MTYEKSQILVDLGLIKIWKKYLLHGGEKSETMWFQHVAKI
jgi:hypothetical protein